MSNKDLNFVLQQAKPKKPGAKTFDNSLRDKKITKSLTNLVPKSRADLNNEIVPLFSDSQNKLEEAMKQTKIEQ